MHHWDDYTDVHDAVASWSSLVFALRPAKTRQDLTGTLFSGGLSFPVQGVLVHLITLQIRPCKSLNGNPDSFNAFC